MDKDEILKLAKEHYLVPHGNEHGIYGVSIVAFATACFNAGLERGAVIADVMDRYTGLECACAIREEVKNG